MRPVFSEVQYYVNKLVRESVGEQALKGDNIEYCRVVAILYIEAGCSTEWIQIWSGFKYGSQV